MPSTTSDSGRKATHALEIHKGGMSGYVKNGETSGGGNVRRKCPGGNDFRGDPDCFVNF